MLQVLLPVAPCQSGRCSPATPGTAVTHSHCRLRVGQQHSGSCSGARLSIVAVHAVTEAAAELAPEQGQWVACNELVQQRCGLDAEEAKAALLKAFGWKGQAFWRQERVKQVPCQEQVTAALDYLTQLGISDASELGPLVRTFPEALGLRVEVMQDNVAVLRDKWYMKGNVLLNSIKRKPRALGNCIDCEVRGSRIRFSAGESDKVLRGGTCVLHQMRR